MESCTDMDEIKNLINDLTNRIKRCEDDINEAYALAKDASDRGKDLEDKVEDLGERMDTIERRMDKLDGKMDTLLDSTSQIKSMLAVNGKDSKSASRNAKGWGFLSVIVTIVTNAVKLLFIL